MSSYDVRVWDILKNTRPKVPTYSIRWLVDDKPFRRTFATKALAESFRSKLILAQREGTAFDPESGLPEPMARALNNRTWYELAILFVDMKWPGASGGHRKGIAEALATVTPAMFTTDRGRPSDAEIRAALYGWAFNKTRRAAGPPPEHLATVVTWLESHTIPVAMLGTDLARVRAGLDALARRMDGAPASPKTVARKRAILSGALRYGVELGLFDQHPFQRVKWTAPKTDGAVERGVVVNPTQATALLTAVALVMPELTAFYGCMYYAALRPEEVRHLREGDYERPTEPGGWGWLRLNGATVAVGTGWGDTDAVTEDRGLKHRARSATRPVPAPPPLCELLDAHLATFGAGPDGRLFVTRRGPGGRLIPGRPRPVPNNTHTAVWQRARRLALTPAQQRSALARRPYDLRHAAVSTWLNAGVPAPQVAEWAGHSVHVLLRVYAKCIDGQAEAARRRIESALAMPSTEPTADDPATRMRRDE
jgi:integrase